MMRRKARRGALWLAAVALCGLTAIVVVSPAAISSAAEAGCPASWGSRVDPPPAVTIDTNARGGTGIEIKGPTRLIGECYPGANAFYPGAANEWLHVVVVRRNDLAPVLNHSYSCPGASVPSSPTQDQRISACIEEVKAQLAKYKDRDHTNLVFATSQYDGKNPGAQPPVGMFRALGPVLGVSHWNWWTANEKVSRGTYTAIGVPGEPGLSTEMVGDQDAPGSSRIVDNLVRDNQGNYVLVPGRRLAFDTRAARSSKDLNIIEVGAQRFQQRCGVTEHQFLQVVLLDAQTLKETSYATPRYSWAAVAGLLRQIERAGSAPFSRPKVVFLASCGDLPRVDLFGTKQAADEITGLGGTRSRFLDAAFHHKAYTLVGRIGLTTGGGQEVVGNALTGTLARTGHYYQYELETANLLSQTSSGDLLTGTIQLLQTIGRARSDWPEVADANGHPPPRAPELAAAIAYIGEKNFDNTPDPRTQYWSYAWGTGAPTHWKDVEAAIARLPFPQDQQQFNQHDFSWAQNELRKEIEWLIAEHTYMEQRAKPFFSRTLESWADLDNIAKQINNRVKAPDKTAEARAGAIFDLLSSWGKDVPLLGKAAAAAIAGYKFVSEWDSIGNEPLGNSFTVKTGEVGNQLAKRLSLAQNALATEVPAVIASDYYKLKTVGECVDTTAPDHNQCPFKPKDWQFTPNDQRQAAEGLRVGSEVAVYAALLPAKYQLYKLPVSDNQEANKKYAGRAGFVCFYPFKTEPDTGQTAVPAGPGEQNPITSPGPWQINALGFLTGSGRIDERWDMQLPAGSVTNPLFGTGKGELGINREEFFSRFFPPPDTLPHYPEATTPTGWDVFPCNGS